MGESQASRLGSHFGLMMLVSVPKSTTEELQDAVKALEGMSTSCYATEDPNATKDSPRVGCKSCIYFFHLHSFVISNVNQAKKQIVMIHSLITIIFGKRFRPFHVIRYRYVY